MGFGFGLLGSDQVVDKWSTMISGADGLGEAVMEDTERLLAATKVPDAKVYRRAISPGVMQGILGGKRPFLVVSNSSNPCLNPYKMYINTRDYGVNLQVSWYLVFQPTLMQKLAAFLASLPIIGMILLPAFAVGKATSSGSAAVLALNIFDEQDLSAYVTNAHHCLLDSVDKLTKARNIETPKIDRQSRGFLGIS